MATPETTAPDTAPEAATYEVAIVGAGYVGVPLAQVFAEAGRRVVLVDVDARRVERLRNGDSYIEDVSSERLAELVSERGLGATTDYDVLRDVDAILIALPTPLSKQREPDLSIVRDAAAEIGKRLRAGQLVVLESTTYPGTTRGEVLPILERESGLEAGKDFHLAFSPERVDPGRTDWTTKTVPKVVGGIDDASTEAAAELYGSAVDTIHRVSSPEAAELTKLLENIYRSVNIALVNELAQLCDRMEIDIWEVVDAAATKPFGFAAFQPGPGLGGHCIPIDPFYLTWKAREFDFATRFIELAGEVNQNMPYYCRSRVSQALNHGAHKSLAGSRVLVLGVAYKADISDWRESPAVKLIELLQNAGAEVAYHDPHVPSFAADGIALASVPFEPTAYDAVVIATAHSGIDYAKLVDDAQLVVDLRNATGRAGITEREGLEALTARVAHVGVGGWGKNVVRVVGELADLAWICDTDEARRTEYAERYPGARVTGSFDDLVADDDVEAIVIATPVPTHYGLAKQALEAGKHVFVEKPPAMRGEEMEELVALAEARELVLMPGHLLLYHPGPPQGEGARRLGRARRGGLRLRQPAEPGRDPLQRERPLVARRPRPVGDPLAPRGGAERGGRARHGLPAEGDRGRRLLLPAVPVGQGRAHASLVARPAQDAEDDRRRAREDGRLRRHGARAEGHRLREGAVGARVDLRRVAHADGRHLEPQDRERRAAAPRAAALPATRRGRSRGPPRGARRAGGGQGARPAHDLASHGSAGLSAEIHPTAVVHPGTVLGEGVKVLEHAVVGKQPTLSPRSTAKREPLPPTVVGDATVISTGAIVFAGSSVGARVILGDQSCVRERVTIGDDVVVGRGSLVENDTTIGARTKIQADAYVTAYSTLEEDVFVAPCVVTTNDNFMGRTEKRLELMKGPTIRRGARVGGGAILCPGVEVGEEAFVGAGAVVTKDVPPRKVVVGSPARVIRDVPDDELLPG